MGQLGYALTGAAQGLTAGKQFSMERKDKKRQQQQQSDELQYRKSRDTQDQRFREGQQARDDLSRVDSYLNDPNANKKYTPEQLASFKAKRDAIYARNPDLDPSQVSIQQGMDTPYGQGTGSQAPALPHTASLDTPLSQLKPGENYLPSDLFDAQQQFKQQPQSPAPGHQDPLQAFGMLTGPQEPNVGTPPITGSQNPVHAGSFPPNPFPVHSQQHPAAPPQGPAQGPVAGPPAPIDPHALRMQIVQRILGDKTNVTPAQQAEADAKALEVLDRLDAGDLQGAQAALARAQTTKTETENALLPRESQFNQLYQQAQIEHLQLTGKAAMLAATAKQTDPKTELEILRLTHDIHKDEAAGNIQGAQLSLQSLQALLGQQNSDRDFGQRQGAIDFQQGHATQGPAFQTFLSTLGKSLVTVDKYTGQVTATPGWEQKYIQSVRQYQQKTGQAPSVADSNPGFHPDAWASASQEGFNLKATLSNLARSGDKRSKIIANQLKAADAAVKARNKVQ